MSDPRRTALDILYRISSSGAYSNVSLLSADLTGVDRAFCTELIKGVTERRRTLDHIISKYVNKAPEGKIYDLLRMGVYQIIFLSRVPDHAVCDESVKTAKEINRSSAGFVNAVLRSVCREKESIINSLPSLPEPVYFSVSDSIFELVKEQYPDEYKEIFNAFFEKRPVCVRANTLKDTPYVDGVNENTDMADIEKGLFFVQGLSSQTAVKALDAREGMIVIDLCACPGGKSFGAAVDMKNKGRIISSDLHKNKLSLIEKGAKKLGIDIIEAVARDARVTDESLIGIADRVICDVPCSGVGVIGSKPEIRYKNAADFAGLYPTQAKILENALLYLKKGGRTVYSTCTVNKRENGDIVHSVLNNKEDYRLVSEKTILPGNGYDGFYIAVIERD